MNDHAWQLFASLGFFWYEYILFVTVLLVSVSSFLNPVVRSFFVRQAYIEVSKYLPLDLLWSSYMENMDREMNCAKRRNMVLVSATTLSQTIFFHSLFALRSLTFCAMMSMYYFSGAVVVVLGYSSSPSSRIHSFQCSVSFPQAERHSLKLTERESSPVTCVFDWTMHQCPLQVT